MTTCGDPCSGNWKSAADSHDTSADAFGRQDSNPSFWPCDGIARKPVGKIPPSLPTGTLGQYVAVGFALLETLSALFTVGWMGMGLRRQFALMRRTRRLFDLVAPSALTPLE